VDLPVYPDSAAPCISCHPAPPHPGDGVGPAFRNHHSTDFDCLVCHWAKRSGTQPDLLWAPQISESGGKRKLVLIVADEGEGGKRDVTAMRETLLPKQKCFDRGPKCTTCHRKDGIGRYAPGGMTADRIKALEKLPDFFTLPKDRKWYFPQLM
jgi:hypothetical protein